MQPGAYWFQGEPTSRAMLLDVRIRDGAMMVWWPNDDQPIAKLIGRLARPDPGINRTG